MNRSKAKTILIADDDQPARSLVRSFVGKDYNVLEASDGEDAVNVARR